MAGSGESCIGMVPGIATGARDGHLQRRHIVGIGTRAHYRCIDYQALWLAKRFRLYGIDRLGVAGGMADFVSAAALESLVARG